MRVVLLVEDSLTQSQLVISSLEGRDYHLDCVQRLDDAIARTRHQVFDAIILDLQLPDSQGLNTYMRMQEAAPDTPIIVLTSIDDEQLALKMLRNGAQDYLIKGETSGDWIHRSLRYAIERFAAARRLSTPPLPPLPDEDLQLEIEEIDDVTVVRIETNQLIGGGLLEQLHSRLFRLVDEFGKRKFVLNCRAVDYLSNSVLGQLLVWDKKIRQNGGCMRICNLQHEVRDQIKVRKMLAKLDVCIDEETALKDFCLK